MKPLVLLLLAGLQAVAAGPFLEAERDSLLGAAKNARMLKASEIPREVMHACREASGDDFAMAESGEAFQHTDVTLSGPGIPLLPRRRLAWAARLSNFCVLHYQQGGFAPKYCLVVASIVKSGKEARLLYVGSTKKLEFAEFLAGLKAGELKLRLAKP